jgi:hypothetical protein
VRPFPDLPGVGDAVRVSVGPPPEIDRFLAALDRVYDPFAGGSPAPQLPPTPSAP